MEKMSITLFPESRFSPSSTCPGKGSCLESQGIKSQNTQGHSLSKKNEKALKKKKEEERGVQERQEKGSFFQQIQLSPKKAEDPKSQCTWESFSSMGALSILQGVFVPLKGLVAFAYSCVCPKFLSSIKEQLCFHFSNQSPFQWPQPKDRRDRVEENSPVP